MRTCAGRLTPTCSASTASTRCSPSCARTTPTNANGGCRRRRRRRWSSTRGSRDNGSQTEDTMAKPTRGQAKIKKVMGEYKRGTLHSGSERGPKVKSRKQAIAIAYRSEEHTSELQSLRHLVC